MRLRILGSGTAVPQPGRGTSAYALQNQNGANLLIDCGPGSSRRWPEVGLSVDNVTTVLNTHHHVDHCCDLPAILFARRVAETECPVTLLGPRGHKEHLSGIRRLYGDFLLDPRVQVRELSDNDQWSGEGFDVKVHEVAHTPGALGVRVQSDGYTMAFSGDSGPCEALIRLCQGVDLALLECSYPKTRMSQRHLNTETVAQIACAAEPKHLVLTHFYNACLNADIRSEVRQAGWHGPLSLASDFDIFQVGAPVAAEASL